MVEDLSRYTITVTETPASFVAVVAELPGCVAAAKTYEELQMRVRQAIEIYLDEHGDRPACSLAVGTNTGMALADTW